MNETTEDATTTLGDYPKPAIQPMRDALAALLRLRGYTHDDAADPDDRYWRAPDGGYGHMFSYLAFEMNCDLGRPTPGWDTIKVGIAR